MNRIQNDFSKFSKTMNIFSNYANNTKEEFYKEVI